jgi:hypothetical protein
MGVPKRKNDINIYGDKETYRGGRVLERRQELLDMITKSDSFLPDSILHEDLDKGMLDYVKNTFVVVTDGKKIPVIEKILTIQRWSEFSNNWEFSDDDGNVKLPFISIIRQPEVQFGTNPAVQRTIPDRHRFDYATVPTWNGNSMGADIYKIPQPIPVDITYEVTIVCTKIRDLNRFNKKVMQNFASRQDYTTVKGHYIPIVLDTINDNSPIETIDGRRFYLQNYKFTMLGFLIDSEEFEVKPAISRMFTMMEFMNTGTKVNKKTISKSVDITVASLIADGTTTTYSVGESIGVLFNVSINGIIQEQDLNFYHIGGTQRITFLGAPSQGDVITIGYYKGKNTVLMSNYGKVLQLMDEYFTYDGSTLLYNLQKDIESVVNISVNGMIEYENEGYQITNSNQIRFLTAPIIGSRIGIKYLT